MLNSELEASTLGRDEQCSNDDEGRTKDAFSCYVVASHHDVMQ